MLAVAYVHAYVPHHNAGGETTMHDLLKALVKRGWEVVVILNRPTSFTLPYEVDGVKVLPYTDRRQILHWVPRADLVLTHLEASERAVFLGQTYRVPVCNVIHNDRDHTRYIQSLSPDLSVFNTFWVRDAIGCDGLNCVVHPPVCPDEYVTDTTRTYVTLVNLWEEKGTNVFYQLAERLPEKQFLGVMGGYGKQDIREGYDNITFVGHTPNIRDEVYAKTKILLMPSTYESFGRVAIEGAASGIPTIAAPTPGLKESLDSAGVFVDISDIDGWEAALKKMLHPRAYSAASKRALKRSAELEAIREAELEYFCAVAKQLAVTAKDLRGW